jgi:hypothetical protein
MMGKPTKYRAVATTVDGIRFASKKEAARYGELKLLERAGHIDRLELQPAYQLVVDGIKVGVYKADFRYRDKRSGYFVVEDVKGVRTPVYKLKKKLVEALYAVRIREV